MKLLLDNLFLLGQVISLAGLAWGASLVIRHSLCGIVFPAGKCFITPRALTASLVQPLRRIARV
jgi:hypothetical protein